MKFINRVTELLLKLYGFLPFIGFLPAVYSKTGGVTCSFADEVPRGIRFWDQGRCLQTLDGHTGAVRGPSPAIEPFCIGNCVFLNRTIGSVYIYNYNYISNDIIIYIIISLYI